jgi:tRNA-specific 2-thiouridylase
VTEIDAGRARVTIGPKEALGRERVAVRDLSWIAGPPASPVRAAVQIRYRHAPQAAWIDAALGEVRFDSPERAAAPGQAAVFYRGDEVLGGGFIA